MDSKLLYWCAVAVFAALCLGASALSIPSQGTHEIDGRSYKEMGKDQDERATWLETRDIEEEFKELVYLSMVELIKEGRFEDITGLEQKMSADKRGRWQGFCFRRTRSGRFLPYICWKGGEEKAGGSK